MPIRDLIILISIFCKKKHKSPNQLFKVQAKNCL